MHRAPLGVTLWAVAVFAAWPKAVAVAQTAGGERSRAFEPVAAVEPPPDPDGCDAVLATGLYCVGPALPEAAMMGAQLEYDWLTDAADTTGAAFLGLTLGCARCHDHKYDPITQADYFALQAAFAASDRPFPD